MGVERLPPVLRETLAIIGWTFWWTCIAGLLLRLALQWPFLVTYFFGILTVAPFLAVWRGRDREKDPLSLTGRAAAEVLALVVLLLLGMALDRVLA